MILLIIYRCRFGCRPDACMLKCGQIPICGYQNLGGMLQPGAAPQRCIMPTNCAIASVYRRGSGPAICLVDTRLHGHDISRRAWFGFRVWRPLRWPCTASCSNWAGQLPDGVTFAVRVGLAASPINTSRSNVSAARAHRNCF